MKWTPETAAIVDDLRAKGWGARRIAAELGVTASTIWKWRNPGSRDRLPPELIGYDLYQSRWEAVASGVRFEDARVPRERGKAPHPDTLMVRYA